MAFIISNVRIHACNLQTYNQENVEKFLSFCCSLHIMQLSQPQISNKQKYKIVFIHISMFHELDYMLLLAIDATREYRCSKIFLQYGLLQRYYQFYIDFNSLISHLLLMLIYHFGFCCIPNLFCLYYFYTLTQRQYLVTSQNIQILLLEWRFLSLSKR